MEGVKEEEGERCSMLQYIQREVSWHAFFQRPLLRIARS